MVWAFEGDVEESRRGQDICGANKVVFNVVLIWINICPDYYPGLMSTDDCYILFMNTASCLGILGDILSSWKLPTDVCMFVYLCVSECVYVWSAHACLNRVPRIKQDFKIFINQKP